MADMTHRKFRVKKELNGVVYYAEGNPNATKSIFFLNGLFHGKKSWIKQRRFFSRDHKLIFMDYRGCGESKSNKEIHFHQIIQDIHDIIQRENLQGVTLLGFSIGGIFSLAFMREYPELIDRLVLINTAALLGEQLIHFTNGVKRLLEEQVDMSTVFSVVYPWLFASNYLKKLDGFESQILWEFANYNRHRESLLGFLKALSEKPDLLPVLPTIEQPTLLISGEEDTIFPPKYQRELLRDLPNAEYYELHRSGHNAYVEQYELVNRSIRQHIEYYAKEKQKSSLRALP